MSISAAAIMGIVFIAIWNLLDYIGAWFENMRQRREFREMAEAAAAAPTEPLTDSDSEPERTFPVSDADAWKRGTEHDQREDWWRQS